MTRLSERFKVVNVIKPADNQAGVTGDSINGGLAAHIMWIVTCGALTGDSILTVKSGASAGTETTSETFRYRLADADQAAAGADGYGDWASSTALTMTAATYDNRVLLVEIDPRVATEGQPWLTLSIDGGASAHNSAVVAVVVPRYAGHDAPTVI